MRIYIDSADVREIEAALETGFVYGATTNPTLLQRAGLKTRDVPTLVTQAIALGARELHAQVFSEEFGPMLQQARSLAQIDPERIVVKIPATRTGYAVASQLSADGIRVTLTAVFTQAQAILAQSVGARYIAVYLGRLKDEGVDALALVGAMQNTFQAQQAKVEILAASIRTPADIESLAQLGVRAATLPLATLLEMTESPRTARAVAAFSAAVKNL